MKEILKKYSKFHNKLPYSHIFYLLPLQRFFDYVDSERFYNWDHVVFAATNIRLIIDNIAN